MAARFLSISGTGVAGCRREGAQTVLTTRATTWRMRAKTASSAVVGGRRTSALGDRHVEFSEVIPRTIRIDRLGQMSGDHDKPSLGAGGANQ